MGWECASCRHENDDNTSKCIMVKCRAKRPANAPRAARAQPPAPRRLVVLNQPVRQRIELQQAQAGGRLRGVNNADQARRRQIKFPSDIEMAPRDRVYGIDATRSALINSYGVQHRREVVELDKLKHDKVISPLKINPLNDGWISDARASKLAPSYYKGFRQEFIDYKTFIGGFPEIQGLRADIQQAQGIKKDAALRRRTFGLLSKAGINFAWSQSHTIFYGLDDMSLRDVFDPKSPFYGTVSSQEIRHAYSFRDDLCPNTSGPELAENTIRFIRNGKEVPPPWDDPLYAQVFRALNGPQLQRRPSFNEMSPWAQLKPLFED